MHGSTILVVDDDAALLAALSVRLSAAGYRVLEAQDAVQAVGAARSGTPDLLLLDVNMPGGDGFTLLERIRSIEGLGDVPVIYVTGDRSVDATTAIRSTGAHAVLYKPFEAGHLLVTIAEVLGATAPMTANALDDLQAAADRWGAGRS